MAEQRLSELCKTLSGHGFAARLEGEDRVVSAVNTLDDATERELSFLSNLKYAKAVATTKAAAVVLKDGIDVPDHLSAVRCDDPYAAITVAIITLHGHRQPPRWGLSERAIVDPSARLGCNPNVGPGAIIAADVRIGDNCTIYPGCYIADRVSIGHDCTLYPNVVIYNDCILGSRVTVHAGSVIGEDGLGYVPHDGQWVKIPQVGRAVLGDDVEIGANCTIDRATLGQTSIGEGTKFGNVVVIGHGTKIGPHCLFVGLVGMAGSVTVGRHVTLGGQVGVAGHIIIGDDVQVAGQSGIMGSLPDQARVLGTPAIPLEKARRSMVVFQRLPDMAAKIKELERQVEELTERLNGNA